MSTATYPTIISTTTERAPHGAFFSVDEIRRANREAGYHYFDDSAMRFFKSRVMSHVFGGRFFITSEQDDFGPRMWSVREVMPDGFVENFSEFQKYAFSATAKRAAKQAANQHHAYYFDGQHGKGGREVAYVITDAIDPWHAMERLHKNFRVRHMGRAQDYMLESDRYVKLQAR